MKMSEPRVKRTIISQRGKNSFIISTGGKIGRVYDLRSGVVYPPMNINSILARGYWETPRSLSRKLKRSRWSTLRRRVRRAFLREFTQFLHENREYQFKGDPTEDILTRGRYVPSEKRSEESNKWQVLIPRTQSVIVPHHRIRDLHRIGLSRKAERKSGDF